MLLLHTLVISQYKIYFKFSSHLPFSLTFTAISYFVNIWGAIRHYLSAKGPYYDVCPAALLMMPSTSITLSKLSV